MLKTMEFYLLQKTYAKSRNSKYGHRLVKTTKELAIDILKTVSKRAIYKKIKATDDLVGNTIAQKITRFNKFDNH